jgi:hypothetical protein
MANCYCPHCEEVHEINFKVSKAQKLKKMFFKFAGKAAIHATAAGAGVISASSDTHVRNTSIRYSISETDAQKLEGKKGYESVSQFDNQSVDDILHSSESESIRPHCSECNSVLSYISAHDKAEYWNTYRAVKTKRAKFMFGFVGATAGIFLGAMITTLLTDKGQVPSQTLTYVSMGLLVLGVVAARVLFNKFSIEKRDTITAVLTNLHFLIGGRTAKTKNDIKGYQELRSQIGEDSLYTIKRAKDKMTLLVLCAIPGAPLMYIGKWFSGLFGFMFFPIGMIHNIGCLIVFGTMSEYEFNSTFNPGLFSTPSTSENQDQEAA